MLLERAAAEASEILVAADELDARRAGLDALGIVVTQQQRAGGAMRQPWPPAIRTALSPEMRAAARMPSRVTTPDGEGLVQRWREVAIRLASDPEAPL